MKRYVRAVLCLILCFILTGCNNGVNIKPTPSAIKDLPSETLNAHDEELENAKWDSFKKIKSMKDNKLKIEDGAHDFFQTSNNTYTIEDKKYSIPAGSVYHEYLSFII